jgi:hypothetical protein
MQGISIDKMMRRILIFSFDTPFDQNTKTRYFLQGIGSITQTRHFADGNEPPMIISGGPAKKLPD